MFKVSSGFICIFKLGDNIVYNLKILNLLYEQFRMIDGTYEQRLLIKPIILLNVAIIEAVLYDFHVRIKNNTSEGVANVALNVANYIRGKKIDEFEKLIISARKHNLFVAKNDKVYDKLDELRRLRNRVHIQNKKNDFEPHEYNAFTPTRKVLSEQMLEIVLKQMNNKYPRDPSYKAVEDFELPWQEHFPTFKTS